MLLITCLLSVQHMHELPHTVYDADPSDAGVYQYHTNSIPALTARPRSAQPREVRRTICSDVGEFCSFICRVIDQYIAYPGSDAHEVVQCALPECGLDIDGTLQGVVNGLCQRLTF